MATKTTTTKKTVPTANPSKSTGNKATKAPAKPATKPAPKATTKATDYKPGRTVADPNGAVGSHPNRAIVLKVREKNAKNKAKELAQARQGGLTLVQFRVLKAIRSFGDSGCTDRDIEKVCGYWSILARILRATSNRGASHEDSLEAQGFIRVVKPEKEPLRSFITGKGRKVLEKAEKPITPSKETAK